MGIVRIVPVWTRRQEQDRKGTRKASKLRGPEMILEKDAAGFMGQKGHFEADT